MVKQPRVLLPEEHPRQVLLLVLAEPERRQRLRRRAFANILQTMVRQKSIYEDLRVGLGWGYGYQTYPQHPLPEHGRQVRVLRVGHPTPEEPPLELVLPTPEEPLREEHPMRQRVERQEPVRVQQEQEPLHLHCACANILQMKVLQKSIFEDLRVGLG